MDYIHYYLDNHKCNLLSVDTHFKQKHLIQTLDIVTFMFCVNDFDVLCTWISYCVEC